MNAIVVITVVKALIVKSSDKSLKVLDFKNLSLAKFFFVKIGFVKRACTTARPEIPEGARKEAELIFHHEIESKVKKYSILASLVINIDQKYAPVSSRTMAAKNSKHVYGARFT